MIHQHTLLKTKMKTINKSVHNSSNNSFFEGLYQERKIQDSKI